MHHISLPMAAFIHAAATLAPPAVAQESYQASLIPEAVDSAAPFAPGGIARVVLFSAAAYYEMSLVGVTGVDSIAILVPGTSGAGVSVTLFEGPRDEEGNVFVMFGMFKETDLRQMTWDDFAIAVGTGRTSIEVYTKDHPEGELHGRLLRQPSEDEPGRPQVT